jgi:hypothetical protein
VYELKNDDPLLQGHPKSAIEVINKIDRDLASLTKRIDEQGAITKRLNDTLDEPAALNARRAEDAAIVEEFKRTGKTPAALLKRLAKEGKL